jgi:hypothetical protein
MVYTDGSVIQSTLQELGTAGAKRMHLATTTATIAEAGICIPRALVTDNIIAQLNENPVVLCISIMPR